MSCWLRWSLCALLGVNAVAAAAPARVVSMNLCADELVLALADKEQIASVSWLVAEPRMSWYAPEAEGIPVNHALAEEIIPLAPDLVVTGAFSNPATNEVLRRLDVPLFELDTANDLEGIERQVLRLADALGQAGRGASVVADMRRRLAQVRIDAAAARLTAVVYEPNGYVAGVDSLGHSVITAAGLQNLAVELGLVNYGRFPLELLVTHRPDLLIMNRLDDTAPSMAHAVLDHPVLEKGFPTNRIVSIPSQAWACGGPNLVAAVEALRNAADRLLAEQG